MKAILMSIHPKWCEKIFDREKTIEVRKTVPKLETPFKVYVYMTKRKWIFKFLPFLKNRFAKVIGSFVCDWIKEITPYCDIDGCVNQYEHHYPAILGDDCLSFEEMKAYLGNKKGYDWHISELKLFDKPRELKEFRLWCEKSRKTDDNLEMCCSCKNAFSDEDGIFYGCGLTRSPQSWCYVEEEK